MALSPTVIDRPALTSIAATTEAVHAAPIVVAIATARAVAPASRAPTVAAIEAAPTSRHAPQPATWADHAPQQRQATAPQLPTISGQQPHASRVDPEAVRQLLPAVAAAIQPSPELHLSAAAHRQVPTAAAPAVAVPLQATTVVQAQVPAQAAAAHPAAPHLRQATAEAAAPAAAEAATAAAVAEATAEEVHAAVAAVAVAAVVAEDADKRTQLAPSSLWEV